MANLDKTAGMRPIKNLNGSPWNGKVNVYYKAAGLAEAMFVGTPVQLAGSADDTGKYPTIKLAGTDPIIGVIVGFCNTPYVAANLTDLDSEHSPVSTASYVCVCDDPGVIFEMQQEASTTDLDADDIGLNASPTTESGNTTTGLSTVVIDYSSINTTSTLSLRIMRLVDKVDNALGDYAKFEVMINNHGLGQGLGSAGV